MAFSQFTAANTRSPVPLYRRRTENIKRPRTRHSLRPVGD
jgi:hypothetical protein